MMRVSKLIETVYDARSVLQQIGDYQLPDGQGGVRTLPILSLDDCVASTAQDVIRGFTTGFSPEDQAAALRQVEEDVARVSDRVYFTAALRERILARSDQEAPAVLALFEVLRSPYHVDVAQLRERATWAKDALELYQNAGNPVSEQQRYRVNRVLRNLNEALKEAKPSLRDRLFGEQPYVGSLSVAAVISHVKRSPPKRAETDAEKRTGIDRESIERKFRAYIIPQRIQDTELNEAVDHVADGVAASPYYEDVQSGLSRIIDTFGTPVHIPGLRMEFVPGTPIFLARATVRFIQVYTPERSLDVQLKDARKRMSQSTIRYAAQFAE